MNKIFRIVWSQATQSWVAVSELTKAHKKQSSSNSLKAVVGTAAVLLSINTAQAAVAIGETTANNTFTQSSAQATGDNAVAIGKGSKATAVSAVALGEAANANQARAIAIGKGATIIGDKAQDTIAIGTDTKVQGHNSIVIGKNAKITDGTAEGTLVIGRDAFSEGSGNGVRPNTVVGRGAYTAFGENGTYRLNAATALGLQAGAGVIVDPDNNRKLVRNNTNADDNANVLVKAGFGLDANAPAETKAALQGGNVNNNLTFYRKNHINEATAIGVEARAIGDQSIAIGGQVVAGDGVVALGGNDTDQLRGNKYQVVTDDAVRSTNVSTIDDYNLAYTESTNTVAGQYNKLVGRDMPTGYRSTYGQSGSVVIGMEAHSTTALGTAIGTNSVVRMGAFGATAIGAGSTVQANAEAAVAIGMGSVANGAYALAGGTASWAEYGDVALGYQAKATGKDGAIAMGRATNAQGDSSIMIGGANIASAAAQNTSFEKDSNQVVKKTVTEKINGKDVRREYSFAGTTPTTGTVADAYKELTGLTMDTAALDFAKNKNGHASTSLGVHALSKGDLGTAIGAGSRSDAIGSVALGTGAHATKQNAVAIGTGSTTDLVGTRQLSISYDKDGNIVDDNSPTKAYTFNWAGGTHTAEGDVVSFGSSGAERQLKNVAAGRVAEDSTDAINGSQLNSISKKVALGWNIAGDPKTKVAGIGSEDQVNFVNGNGTTVTVTKQEEVKNGDTVTTAKGANVKFDVKAADGSITSNENGISVNTDDATIGKTPDGKLKANTGTINTGNDGKAAPNAGDGNKLATVDTVVNAVNNAAWKATAGSEGTGTETGKSEEKIKAGDLVTFKAGDNLAIKQEGKNFIYSLNPVLTGLTSATFTNAAGDTTVINGNGMTITPKDAPANPVSLTKDGLNNGGNPITNVAGNLDGAKTGTTAPTTNATKPATLNNSNAATVGDVLNAGWNLQGNTTAKDFVTAYDTVNFVDGNGTTVSVENTDGKTSTIKYSVNTGNGLQKDPTGNTISVKPADKSLEVTNDGLKVNTGNITASSVPTVADDDKDKIATVGNVADAIKAAAWKATSAATTNGENSGKKDQEVKAGDTVTFEADKNIKIAQADGKFTFSTKDDVEFTTVKVGDTTNGKKPVELKNGDVINANNNPEQPTTALNVSSDNKPTQITGVGSVLNTEAVPTIPAGTATTGNGQPKLVNLGTGHNQTALGNNVLNAAATVRDLASMGWVVSSDKTTDATGEYKDVVKNANEVKFVGKNAAKVSGKTDPKTGIRTITVDVEAPDVKTAELVSSKDGSVIAPSTNPELQKALKDAKDELAALPKEATPEQKEAAENKVKAAETALNNAVDNKGVATAKNVADMINASGFTLKTSATADGKKESGDDEVINPGKAVEMVAGKNLTVKQEANGKVAYSTKDEVEFNTVKLGDAKDGKAPVNMKTEAAKPATNNGADQPTTALNFTSGEGDKAKPTQLTGVGSTLNTQDIVTAPQGKDNTNKPNVSLVNLVGTDDAPVNKNAAATVGDLQNMGWVVSTKDGNGYKDVVKNANQVDFKGTGLATVTGETKDGIRTITVNVDAQKTVEAAQNPVVYTDSEGNKVTKLGDNFYPVEEAKDAVKIGDNYYPAGTVLKDGKPVDSEGNEATALVPTDKKTVKASMNNGDNKAAPTVLSNVGSNLPTVDDVKKQAFNPNDSKNPLAKKSNKAAPITALEAAELLDPTSDKFAGNNAATVSDVLNAGWNLQNNGEARDFVKPYDTVNFINGKGTVAVVETADDAASSTVKFDVDAGEITSNTNGSVNGPTTAENAKKLADDLKKAEQAVKDLPTDATEDKKAEAQKALKDAQDAAAPLNKVATAQNVADMINASGFTLKTSKAEGGEKDAASTGDEVINPGKAVEMVAGKNLTVKQEANGKVTYSTKDDVEFNTVKLGDAKDGKAPVNMKTEAAKPATNNGADQPTTALNISSSDGKPTQITGVGSTLNVKPVDTNTNGTPTADADKPNLVDLVGTKDAPVNKNAAATVGDLQNMGWVVSAKDNNYTNTVKNANKVEFKGDKGISVTGKDVTQADGTVTREITVAIADGKVTDKVTITKDGKDIPAIKIGDNYYEVDKNGKPVGYEVDEKGKPTANNKPIDVTDATITNEGNKVVTGNTVATAIQESGWNVGLADSSKANEAFNDSSKALSADKLEKVNPDDNVRFADGKNTKVQAATMDEVNKDGKKITNTYVRFNVDLPISQITSEDKDGNKVAKAADGKWYPVKEGKPDTTKEALEPSNVRTSASMDPDGLGDKYTSTTSREEGLTPTQLGELTGKQEAAAKAAEEKIKDLLKGQSKDVIEAASKAAVDAAKEEAKVQYLKDNGLDKGTGGTVISNVAWGTKPSDAVNVDQLQNSGINVHSRTVEGSTGKVISGNTSPTKVKMDETVNVDAGNNIEITRNGRDIAIATSMTPKFDSVQFGKEGPKITNKAGNINVSGPDGKTPTKITGVAPGEISATSKDAINGSQLHAVASNLNNKINKVGKHADAGTASALAAANIPQAYTPGKSLVGIAAGNYQGQNGLAVGMSRISDNGKIIIRLSGTANSQGKTGVAAGVGYQW
ncbi:MAG: YadA-like family protein [Haemophilus parainfluenzae]|uniref:YadA-like family protein n=8 Tax=Pasteurellaceae TaxID=712 RepID=UPI000DAB96EF|nr:YadA-like family protein [Haemophilus parainfluenzae]MDU3502864.1 YadA-like family protein [Haemophilus parainfluenzae]RDE99892.1 hypothetical protein DPV89_09265 [Haemophilus parainfluenzae]